MARLRLATVDDAPQIAAIYEPIVRHTAISFELEPPSAEDMGRRIEMVASGHPWVVAEEHGLVVGYAYATALRQRPAYRWSVETTVYVHAEHRGRGIGANVYAGLLAMAEMWGFANAFAGITSPNPTSESLHASAGFSRIGVFPRAGHKFDRWHDVSWWHRPLSLVDPPQPPAAPAQRLVAELLSSR